MRAAILAATLAAASPALAGEPSPWTACHSELKAAAERHGVPYRILEAVAAAESGRAGNGYLWPWPWTVNADGKARFFATRAEATAHARRAIEAGRRNVDIGCMQLNWRWHGDAFGDPDRAMEPRANVDYAAQLLAREYRQTGAWSEAVARYHSRTPAKAVTYQCRVAVRLAGGQTPTGCERK